jgi:predicted Zn finger-like uncharacterized protein
MTLATRCSACGTSFRVVQDQLKVSGGWVRCGRCNEVFNALESLYEIEAQAGQSGAAVAPPKPPPPESPALSFAPPKPPTETRVAVPAFTQAVAPSTQPASPPPSAIVAAPEAPVVTPPFSQHSSDSPVDAGNESPNGHHEEAPTDRATGSSSLADGPAAWVPFKDGWPQGERREPRGLPPAIAPAPETSEPAAFDPHADAEMQSPIADAASVPGEWDDRPVHGFEDVETRLEPRPGEDIGPTPSFLRTAQRPEAALSSEHRRSWVVAASALALLLAVQGLVAWRDSIAARAPALEPVLSALCLPFRCRVNAPRYLTAMALEGSNLRQRAGVGSGYELIVALRNRSAAFVMWPSFELTLTDSQGQALIRRVLSPEDFGVSDNRLGPAAEFNLQTQLDVADRRIAGYTVEIFYP